MANVKVYVCHPSEEYCGELISSLRGYDSELELTALTDLRGVIAEIGGDKPEIVVVGVDGPDDPALRTVDAIISSEERPGVIVVGQSSSPDLLVACLRAGCDEFLEYPIDAGELSKALRGLYRKRGVASVGEGMVTAVYSAKGGAGTTTVACNLAAQVARALNSETASCLLDLNLQFGSAVLFLDIREFSHSLADACRDAERLDSPLLRTYMTPHASGTAVLVPPLNTEELDEIDPARLSAVVELCRKVYDHVILDLPHSIDGLAITGMDLADQVLLVCDMGLPGIRNTIRAVKMFQELEYDKSKLKLVVNRYYSDSQITLQEMAEHVGLPIYWLVPYDSRAAIEATNSGQTLADVDRNSPAAQSLTALGQELAGVPVAKPPKKKALFGWRK